jgi:hypothetical protein
MDGANGGKDQPSVAHLLPQRGAAVQTVCAGGPGRCAEPQAARRPEPLVDPVVGESSGSLGGCRVDLKIRRAEDANETSSSLV